MQSDTAHLLGIPVERLTMIQAVTRLRELLDLPQRSHVVTLNNEMVVEAAHHQPFHSVLQHTINLPDSTGVTWFARAPQRVPGVDLVRILCAALPADCPVYLLGAADGIAEKAAAALKLENSNITIAGTYAGSPAPHHASAIIDRINASGAQLLLVAYGAPRQDLWIAEHFHQLNTVRVAIGVGGTFDFLAGTIKRAPLWLRAIGLEWLWRLALQPKRAGRIWKAVVVFPWLLLAHKR